MYEHLSCVLYPVNQRVSRARVCVCV
jgi:hypothetical protein